MNKKKHLMYTIALTLMLLLGLAGCDRRQVEKLSTAAEETSKTSLTLMPSKEDVDKTQEAGSVFSGDDDSKQTQPVNGTVDENGQEKTEPMQTEPESTQIATEVSGPEILKRFYIGDVLDQTIVSKNNATIMSGLAGVFDLTDEFWWMAYSEEWNKETVVKMIEQYQIPEGTYYLDGQLLTEEMKTELQKLRAMNSIPATPVVNYGIAIDNTAVRMYPTMKRLTMGEETSYDPVNPNSFDRFQESMLTPGEAVLILNTSTDGNYYFVQAENDFGWVLKKDITTCTYEIMCHWLTAMDFAVVTSSDLTYRLHGEEKELRMGSRLLLYTETDSTMFLLIPGASGQKSDYALTLRNGSFELIEDEWIALGDLPVNYILVEKADMTKGYLPLNDENVTSQASRLLGMPYGWGDENGMDCSSTVNAVFRCFGLKLPRNTGKMSKICGGNSNVVTDLSTLNAQQKLTAITSSIPGTILLMPGHVMIYMGKIDGVPMILHNVVAYMSPDNTIYCPIGSCVMTPIDIVSKDVPYYERIIYMISLYE